MELESIKKIVEAEQEAEKIKNDAMQKAKTILEKAKNTRESSKSYFKGQLEEKRKELEKEYAEKNVKTIHKIKNDTTERLQKIRENSEGKISQAVEQVFFKVIKA